MNNSSQSSSLKKKHVSLNGHQFTTKVLSVGLSSRSPRGSTSVPRRRNNRAQGSAHPRSVRRQMKRNETFFFSSLSTFQRNTENDAGDTQRPKASVSMETHTHTGIDIVRKPGIHHRTSVNPSIHSGVELRSQQGLDRLAVRTRIK